MYSNELVCDILEFIDNNFKRDISIEEISFRFSFNRYYVMKKFKKEIGDSIISYINKLRIYSSLDELNNTDNSIVLISINSGFNSLEYYSEIFKNIIGVSPSKYRKLFLSRYRKTEYDKIQDNVIMLYNFIYKAKEYKKNRRPKGNPVLIRSIFR